MMKLRPVDWLFITALLLLATGLRFFGLSFGQPNPSYAESTFPYGLLQLETPIHPDEFQFVSIPLRMLVTGDFRTGYLVNPTLLTNLNMATYWLTGAAAEIDHELREGLRDSARQYAPFPLYIIGRVYSALGGVLGVAAVYATARLLAGRYAAAAAGLLAAVSFTLVQHSHYTTQTSLSGGLAVLCVWASLVALRSGARWRLFYLLACVLAGLAFSSRYNAGGVLVVPLLTGFVLVYHERTARNFWTMAAGLGLFVVSFLVGTPYALAERRVFIEGFLYGFQHYLGGLHNPTRFENGLFYIYRHLLVFGMGIPAAAAALMGIIYAVRVGRPVRRNWLKPTSPLLFTSVLLIYMVAYSLVVLRTNRLGSDQLLVPLLPVVVVLAGLGVGWAASWLGEQWPVIRSGLVLALLLIPLTLSLQFIRQLRQADTRQLMQAWFVEHVPKGVRVHLHGSYNIPLDEVDYPWTQTYGGQMILPDELAALDADYLILSDAWYHHIRTSAEVIQAEYLQSLQDYLELLDQHYELIASIERPAWTGYDWGVMHTANYWHNPGLRVYCLHPAACGRA